MTTYVPAAAHTYALETYEKDGKVLPNQLFMVTAWAIDVGRDTSPVLIPQQIFHPIEKDKPYCRSIGDGIYHLQQQPYDHFTDAPSGAEIYTFQMLDDGRAGLMSYVENLIDHINTFNKNKS
ncbi:hypothetical protein ACVOZ6_004704 [Escherichia coli]